MNFDELVCWFCVFDFWCGGGGFRVCYLGLFSGLLYVGLVYWGCFFCV